MGTTWCPPLPSPWASLFRAANAFWVTWSGRSFPPVRLGYVTEFHWRTGTRQSRWLGKDKLIKGRGERIELQLREKYFCTCNKLATGVMVACEQASFMVFSFVWSFFPSVFHARISRHFCPLKLAMLTLKLNRQQFFLACALIDHRNVQKPLWWNHSPAARTSS